MLSERSQTQEIIYCMIPFISNVQKRQIYRDGKCISGFLKEEVRISCKWVCGILLKG